MTEAGDQTDQRDQSDDGSGSETTSSGSGGQVSELSAMSTEGGAGDIPGTDDGVPPAEDAGSEADGPPRDYDQD